ncbi:MAG: ATP-binding protein [Planctomycetota bacterium]|jgi:CO dehydrogenase maturation factor
MATTIAISGKGGSGKTTVAAMIIRTLLDRSGGAVLGVDADPNSCLGLTMGVQPVSTVAELREQARSKKPGSDTLGKGLDKVRSLEYGIQQALTEAEGFDLLTMGRPEGPDCYCAVNNFLRKFIDELSSAYGFMVVDNEAGMEHLSRRTTNNIDLLCIVTESSPVGVITAKRIFELAKRLPISVKEIGIVWNRSENVKQLEGIESLGYVPYDEAVFDASMQNKTIFDVEQDSPAFLAVRKILQQKLSLEEV